jgi:site-specific DNA-cytosine methylase
LGLVLSDVLDLDFLPKSKPNERLNTSYFSTLGMGEFKTDCVSFTTVSRYKTIDGKPTKLRNETIVMRGHKHATLTTSFSSKIKINYDTYDENFPFENCCIRKVTPNEAEKLQTVPLNYTEGVANTHRYKALGNGWTVSVIEHIMKGLLDV